MSCCRDMVMASSETAIAIHDKSYVSRHRTAFHQSSHIWPAILLKQGQALFKEALRCLESTTSGSFLNNHPRGTVIILRRRIGALQDLHYWRMHIMVQIRSSKDSLAREAPIHASPHISMAHRVCALSLTTIITAAGEPPSILPFAVLVTPFPRNARQLVVGAMTIYLSARWSR